jgi:glutamine cyclotransferase
MKTQSTAEILNEHGPFPGIEKVHGVTYDGEQVWLATGTQLRALDPATGKLGRSIDAAAHAGSACDGKYLYQIAERRIHKIDPRSGQVLSSIPAPGDGGDSGLAWAEGTLWVGQYRERKIHQVDPDSGKVLRTITATCYVTGVTWVDGELWHGTWEGEMSELQRIDPVTGATLESVPLPRDMGVSGLESDGGDRFFCGGGASGKLRVVRRPRRR